MVVAGEGDDRDHDDVVDQYKRMMTYRGSDFCDGNSKRLEMSPRTVVDHVSVDSADSPLIIEEGMTFETCGRDDVAPYSSFDIIGWEIVEFKKKQYCTL